MHLHRYVPRPPRGKEFGEAIRLMPVDLARLRVRRDAEILVDSGAGCLIRWHLTRGPWSALPRAAIGALRGFHHAILAPGATWPMHIHEDLQAVTYVVEGALEHSDSLGNHGVVAAGGVQQRWLDWGSEHQEWNPSATAGWTIAQSTIGCRAAVAHTSSMARGSTKGSNLQPASHERGMLRCQPSRVLLCAIEDDNACSRRQERPYSLPGNRPAPSTDSGRFPRPNRNGTALTESERDCGRCYSRS
jgi:uncharacterized RmlC-like cupin family protein